MRSHINSRRSRGPKPNRRRALELLAGSRDGMTEAMLLAYGFMVDILVDLIRAGLATAKTAHGRRWSANGGCPRANNGRRPTVARGACQVVRAPMTRLILKRASASRPSDEWGEDDVSLIAALRAG
jgi:hypothetical protein